MSSWPAGQNQPAKPANRNGAPPAVNNQPLNPPKRRLVGLFKEPRPALLQAPCDEATARKSQRKWAAHLKMPVEVTNSLGMKLVVIPPGEFLMGSDDATAPVNERPQHRVRISRLFLLGAYEVTQEEFKKLMGVNPSKFADDPRQPLEQVTWDQCQDFLRRLSDLGDEKQAGRSYRLPTEAEWEYACRAGTQTRTCYGDSLAVDQANFNGEHAAEPGINRRRDAARRLLQAKRLGVVRHAGECFGGRCGLVLRDLLRAKSARRPAGSAGRQFGRCPWRRLG